MSAPIRIEVNGTVREVPSGATVAIVVAATLPDSSGCAAALNGEVVPRSSWAIERLQPGDRLEILSAAPGG
jgi:sulfur carrier protein